jgi:hypothetical protein
MNLEHVYIEDDKDIILNNDYTKENNYYRCILHYHNVDLYDTKHNFAVVRYFNMDKVYVKTINVILMEGKLLENNDIYVSFKIVNDALVNRYSYGVYSKLNIKLDIDNPHKIEVKGNKLEEIPVDYDIFDRHCVIIYKESFRNQNPLFKYKGIDTNPNRVKPLELTSFVNKNISLIGEVNNYILTQQPILKKFAYSEITIISDVKIYLKQVRDINEDSEILF